MRICAGHTMLDGQVYWKRNVPMIRLTMQGSELMVRTAPSKTTTGTRIRAVVQAAHAALLPEAPWRGWLLAQVAVVAPVVVVLGAAAGAAAALLALTGAIAALAVQNTYTWAMHHRIGPEPSSAADLLTHGRGAVAAALAALVVARFPLRPSAVGWALFGLVLAGVTLLDWLDGPLARRAGPTRLGGALDIEVDSWLTLWCAIGAVTLAGLPWWCLVPPLAHYSQPVYRLRHGQLPGGGGPLWTRVTGVAQMVVLLGALAPLTLPWRIPTLTLASVPVAAAQLVAVLYQRTV
jgi:phosphatidylglycerophosphate synthase